MPQKKQSFFSFCYITDNNASSFYPEKQVKTAIKAGATIIRYLNESFSPLFYQEAEIIRNICKSNSIPFIITGNILLAKGIKADGVLLNSDDDTPETARAVLGDDSIVGISVSSVDELKVIKSDICDYIELSILNNNDKIALGSHLQSVIEKTDLPVIVSEIADTETAKLCFKYGAAGIAVKTYISRAKNPVQNSADISLICGILPRFSLDSPWNNEFALLKKLMKKELNLKLSNQYLDVPSGDDAALLKPLMRPVITTDTQRERIHFNFAWQTPEEIGAKAVEAAFSDLAASYADPVGLFVNLGIPPYLSDTIIEKIYSGIRSALLKYNAFLGGGNISGAESLSLDLFAIGDGHKKLFPVRSKAIPGNGLYATGPLGLARAGLESLKRRDPEFNELIIKFISPKARFDAARVLAESRVNCVIDISDGLAGDAFHIAKASNITIKLDLSSYPFDDTYISFCKKYNLSVEETALSGGEDYELLFTCSETIFKNIKKKLPEAFKAGICMEFNGEYIISPFSSISSFQHGNQS